MGTDLSTRFDDVFWMPGMLHISKDHLDCPNTRRLVEIGKPLFYLVVSALFFFCNLSLSSNLSLASLATPPSFSSSYAWLDTLLCFCFSIIQIKRERKISAQQLPIKNRRNEKRIFR